jgi:hypothetical protein
MNLNALGALLFGNLTLGFLGACALVLGGPAEITAIAIAMACSYGAQLLFYTGEQADLRQRPELMLFGAILWIAAVFLAVLGGIATVWF